jgi:hypothetical protein
VRDKSLRCPVLLFPFPSCARRTAVKPDTLPNALRYFKPQLYRNADRLPAFALVRRIMQEERKRGHPLRIEEAELCFATLRHQSWRVEEAMRIQSENPEYLLDAMRITQHFKAARFRVSYMHHRECFVELGQDANAAAEWLKQAESNHWTVSQMLDL